MKLTFKSNPTTVRAAQIIGIGYIFYGIFMLGLPGLLLSLAIGLIVMGINGSFEVAVATSIIVGVMYRILYRQFDGYQTYNPTEVVDRLRQMKGSGLKTAPVGYDGRMFEGDKAHPDGVLASDFAEGFANPEADKGDATGTSASGSSASETAASSAPAPAAAPATNEKKDAATATTQGFQGSSDGLFKLGEIPSDMKGGPHIDAGSTILSAIQNLKPDQIKSMTDDTRKLLDTQKSLLGMLENMKPMIADGSQLLSSFNTMFGKTAQ
jgi:hypothetical protein